MAKNNKKTVILVVWLVLLGGLMYGITHFNSSGGGSGADGTTPPAPKDPPAPTAAALAKQWPEIVKHAAAPPRGSANTPYTIAEFGDFQCPQCGHVRPLIERLLAKYPNQVNLIFVHRPFPNIHHWAIPAAEASEVAAAQGKFWPMYDALYSHQDDLEPGFYGNYAAKIGLNKSRFEAALKTPSPQQAVKQASDFSDSLGVEETPTLVLHDNVHNTVTVYVGLTGSQAPGAPKVLGVQALIAHPPWAATPSRAASAKS